MEKTSDGSYVKDGKVVWEPKSEKIKESCKNRAEEFDLRRQTIDDGNPCLEEGQMALECLKKNMYNKAKCSLEFENTRACKKFWFKVKRNRMLNGIHPFLPDKEEREEVKKQYAHLLED